MIYVVRYVADDGHMTERGFPDLPAAQAFLRSRDGYITRRPASSAAPAA